LGKFVDLQDFNANLYIVADGARRREYETKLGRSMFDSISGRVKFMSYVDVSALHSRTNEYFAIANRLQ
jgi:hypothetical protein